MSIESSFESMKIIPVNQASLTVRQEGRQLEFHPVFLDESEESIAEGSLTLQIGKLNPTYQTVQNGEMTIAPNTSLLCKSDIDAHTFRLTTKDDMPEVVDIQDDPEHSIPLTGPQVFPKVKPQFLAWNVEKKVEDRVVKMEQASEILQWSGLRQLIAYHLITPNHMREGVASEFDAKNIVRAFLLKSMKEDTKSMFWSEIKPSMVAPYTESLLRYIESKADWKNVVSRALAYRLDLQKTMDVLHTSAKNYRSR